jgi:hypothetical protein
MSSTLEGYSSGIAVAAAIKAAARKAANGQSPSVDSLIRQTTFDRFPSRVFSSPDAGFVLKGGTGMLARTPQARATQDIDLSAGSQSLDAAVAQLIELARVDLNDYFRFTFERREDQIEGENQPYTSGCRLTFKALLGVNPRGHVSIDLAVGYSHTAPLDTQPPTNRLAQLRLRNHDYVLYPVPDQIADKVCATLQRYGAKDSPSTREKDLVDLVMIAITHPTDAAQLRIAIYSEMARRSMGEVSQFAIPTTWGVRYKTLAQNTSAASSCPTAESAEALVVQ